MNLGQVRQLQAFSLAQARKSYNPLQITCGDMVFERFDQPPEPREEAVQKVAQLSASPTEHVRQVLPYQLIRIL